jgi:hypothetical protein
MSADWNWSERDEAMAGRILAAPLAADPDALRPGHLADYPAADAYWPRRGGRLAPSPKNVKTIQ